MNHSHYFKSVKHLETIDVYRVLDLFAVTDSALAHAAKKILCAGNRGAKDQAKDVQEAIDSLQRWQEMQRENIVGMTAQEAIAFEGVKVGDKITFSGLWDNREFTVKKVSGDLWNEDKELPSSGIYGDEGYTEADKQAASLDPALVELCSKTTIHADADGWYTHIGIHCPVDDLGLIIQYKRAGWKKPFRDFARDINWAIGINSHEQLRVTKWRYAK